LHIARLTSLAAAVLGVAAALGCSAVGYEPMMTRKDTGPEAAATAREPAATLPAAPAIPRARRVELLEAAHDDIVENRYAAAVESLRSLADATAPDDPQGPEVFFWLGFCEQELSRPAEARAAYGRVLRDWPNSRYASYARKRLAELN
jgi:hypothetical protein